ncbi:MAG TPA: orotidine-5'-phosphate decarboxylase [Sphingomicrobium sp.]|nr:orotidine-5'-phosphate decarboxylase [Sphingomicrobium sp.]
MKPIFVAVDTPDVHKAAAVARKVCGIAGGVKLGLEFFCANGREGVLRVAEHGMPIFLDLKLHDIPNTVAKAVEALAPLDPAILSVHAAGGIEMMRAARAAAPRRTRVVGVTVLTSLDQDDLAAGGIAGSPAEQVARLAAIAREAGIDGIVCSGEEVAAARAAWPEGFLVVPGVRPAGAEVADQKRVVTPRQALDDGASVLVIGRPITAALDPARAIADIAADLTQTPEEART